MTIDSGKITGSEIGKNIDSETETQILQVEGPDGKDDGQTPEEMHVPNLQYKPVTGARAFFVRIARSAWKICTGIDDHIPKFDLNEGECILYSHDGSVIKARIFLGNDGKLRIGNGTEELLDLFDQVLTELQKSVDLSGAASTGTLFKINDALEIIQQKLATIKG